MATAAPHMIYSLPHISLISLLVRRTKDDWHSVHIWKEFSFYYDTISMHFLSYMKRANRMDKPVKLTQKRASNNLNTHIKFEILQNCT